MNEIDLLSELERLRQLQAAVDAQIRAVLEEFERRTQEERRVMHRAIGRHRDQRDQRQS